MVSSCVISGTMSSHSSALQRVLIHCLCLSCCNNRLLVHFSLQTVIYMNNHDTKEQLKKKNAKGMNVKAGQIPSCIWARATEKKTRGLCKSKKHRPTRWMDGERRGGEGREGREGWGVTAGCFEREVKYRNKANVVSRRKDRIQQSFITDL